MLRDQRRITLIGEINQRNRKPMFLAPGAKVSSTIGGSGWLSLECNHQEGIRHSDLAPDMMPAAISDDRVVEAFEMPGFHWVFGVQWDVFWRNSIASRVRQRFGGVYRARDRQLVPNIAVKRSPFQFERVVFSGWRIAFALESN